MAENTLLKIISSRRMPVIAARTVLRLFAFLHRMKSCHLSSGTSEIIETESPIYFMEGYHGGLMYWDWIILRNGGLWKTLVWPAVGESILYRASKQNIPVSLELDAPTFRYMDQNQKKAISRLKEMISSGRVEIVNGTYSQPLLQALSGESIIRQFEHGLRIIRETTGSTVKSYACQEPCFCSQLPQILAGFNIPYALIRTHWAPFGEESGFNSPFIIWQGPDGSSVAAVPRYSWMDYTNRDSLYKGILRGNLTGSHSSQWNRKHLEESYRSSKEESTLPLLLSTMEDLSPHESPIPLSPSLAGQSMLRFTTLSEFIKIHGALGSAPEKSLTSDDFIMTLPWGLDSDKLINQIDETESMIHAAERLDAIATFFSLKSREKDLSEAWENLMYAQHHDFILCGGWLSLAHDKTMAGHAGDICRNAREAASSVIHDMLNCSRPAEAPPDKETPCIVLFNPHAEKLTGVTHISGAWRLVHNERCLESQTDLNETSLYFELPPLDIRRVEICAARSKTICHDNNDSIAFSNEHYDAALQNGLLTIVSGGSGLLEKGSYFTAFTGGHMADSREYPVSSGPRREGAVLSRLTASGTLPGMEYRQTYSFYKRLPRIDIETEFIFDKNTCFGPLASDGKGFYSMDDRKLCVNLPLMRGEVIRSMPFITESTVLECFTGNNWAGIESRGSGIAVICPGARGFHYDKNSGIMRLVLAWSPRSWMYASDDSFTPDGSIHASLKGVHAFRYSLLPYRNRTEAIRCSEQMRVPAICIRGDGNSFPLPEEAKGLFSVFPEGIILTSLFARNGRIFGRLHNPINKSVVTEIISEYPLKVSACGMNLEDISEASGPKIKMRPYSVQTFMISKSIK